MFKRWSAKAKSKTSAQAYDDQIAALLTRPGPKDATLRAKPVPIPQSGPSNRYQRDEPPALVIENFLTPAECEALIALSEDHGYEPAQVNIGSGKQISIDSVRRSSRCMIDTQLGARVLFERLQPHLLAAGLNHGPKGGWRRCVELNERLRFLKYKPGDYFKPHQDGRFVRPAGDAREGDQSLLTLMLYLNTPRRGGGTNFIGNGPTSRVIPTTGLALIFDHSLLHEGATLEVGHKYCIRTDVMYTRREGEPTAPRTTDAAVPGGAVNAPHEELEPDLT